MWGSEFFLMLLDGVTGFVVNGTDCTEISARICQLLQDQQLRQSMGDAGRQWIISDWRWQIWASKFAQLLAG